MSVKDINIKNPTYYVFDDIMNMKDFHPNNRGHSKMTSPG